MRVAAWSTLLCLTCIYKLIAVHVIMTCCDNFVGVATTILMYQQIVLKPPNGCSKLATDILAISRYITSFIKILVVCPSVRGGCGRGRNGFAGRVQNHQVRFSFHVHRTRKLWPY